MYARLKEGVRSQPRQAKTDPRIDKLIKDNEDRQKQTEEDTMRSAAFDSLGQTYTDFNKDSVMEAVKKLEEIAPGDQMRSFMELLYFAGKGRTSPAQMEQTISNELKRKQSATTPMGNTNNTPNKGSRRFTSFDEAAEAAHNNL